MGRGLDAIVVPLDAELPEGAARLRGRDRGHRRDARGPALRRGVPAAARALPPPVDGRTGRQPWVDRFAYPFRWFYSVLNAAEYFREAALLDGVPPDPRMADAIELIRAARQPDGTWLQAGRHPGRVWFEVDVPAGEPSKWLTLYGTRVLDWWDSHAP